MENEQWMPLATAVELLQEKLGSTEMAIIEIGNRINSGLMPITCERVVIRSRHGEFAHDWPGDKMHLADMIGAASRARRVSGISLLWQTGYMTWRAPESPSQARFEVFGLHVSSEGARSLAGLPSQPDTSPAQETARGRISDETLARKRLTAAFADGNHPVNEWARARFYDEWFRPTLSERAFDRAWAEAAKDYPERRAGGRRANKPSA